MLNDATAYDELFLFVLSRIHYRHSIVYNMKRSWTTLCIPYMMTNKEIHAACDLHLIYLGQDVYGLLQPTMSTTIYVNPSKTDPKESIQPSIDTTPDKESPLCPILEQRQVPSRKLLLVKYLKTSSSPLVNPVIYDTPMQGNHDDEKLKPPSNISIMLSSRSLIPP